MGTSGTARKTMDWSKIREAVTGPGIDPRVWVLMGRIDDNPDAVRWEAPHGWIADITVHGGPLDQEGPIACRVACALASNGEIGSCPVQLGDEVIVVVPVGDANAGPIIVGQLSGGEKPTPTTVNGFPLEEAFALLNLVLRAAKGLQVELDGLTQFSSAQGVQVISDALIMLGGTPLVPPIEPVIKGASFVSALASYLGALQNWATQVSAWIALAGAVPTNPPAPTVATTFTAYAAAMSAFGVSAPAALSTRVLTE